jgi:hypothetical protein
MAKDIYTLSQSHEHLFELSKGIRVAGVKEKKLTEAQQSVVATIRDLVVHIVEKKDIARDYSLVQSVGQLPKDELVMTGADDWLRIFNQEDGSLFFRPEDLRCELLQVTGEDPLNQMTKVESLSSGWRLGGLPDDRMNEHGITYDQRVKLLQDALVKGQLFIISLKSSTCALGNDSGPVITGRKL